LARRVLPGSVAGAFGTDLRWSPETKFT